MSYGIIRNISINHKTKEVWITGHSNNVYPRTPSKWHCGSLTDIYKTQGLDVLEKEILQQFMCGNFQKGTSDYRKSLQAYGCPKSGNDAADYGYDREQAYANLLLYRAEKSVKVKIGVGNAFVTSTTKRGAKITSNEERAKVFSLADFRIFAKRFANHSPQPLFIS